MLEEEAIGYRLIVMRRFGRSLLFWLCRGCELEVRWGVSLSLPGLGGRGRLEGAWVKGPAVGRRRSLGHWAANKKRANSPEFIVDRLTPLRSSCVRSCKWQK